MPLLFTETESVPIQIWRPGKKKKKRKTNPKQLNHQVHPLPIENCSSALLLVCVQHCSVSKPVGFIASA